MCGITGIYCLDDSLVNEQSLVRFNNSQKHRGPDGHGIYIDEEKKIGLGHRRLAIIDVSENASQPMAFDNGRYQITFNGEIYNFLELRKELLQHGQIFHTDSDTEVILSAYKLWGASCQDKVNGMWAFAIWDNLDKKIFLSRDRFGIKPLHILFIPGKILAFASETIAFKNLDGFERKINKENLCAVLQNTFALEGYGKTIFENMIKLPPGHYGPFKKG